MDLEEADKQSFQFTSVVVCIFSVVTPLGITTITYFTKTYHRQIQFEIYIVGGL